MVLLAINQPHSTADPQIVVENKLEPGKYRFRLVVLDEAQNASVPADIIIQVMPKIIDPIIPDIRIRPDRILRPDVITRPVVEPVIDPGILRPGRFTRPGG
jgi:hypothetical protein